MNINKNKLKIFYFFFAVALILILFYLVEQFTPVKCVDLMIRYGERELILRTRAVLIARYFLGICIFASLILLFFIKRAFFAGPVQLGDLIKSSELMLLQNWEKAQKYESVMRNMLEKDLENYRNFLEHQFRRSPSLSLCISLQQFSSLDKEALYLYLTKLAQPEQHVGVFLSICEYLGLSHKACQLKNKSQK
jgi:hypothetical protein